MKDKKSLIRIIKSDEGMMIDVTGKKMAEELMYVRIENVLKRLLRQKGLTGHLVSP